MNKYLLIKKYLMNGNTIYVNAMGNSMFPFWDRKVRLLVTSLPLTIGCCVLAFSEDMGCRVHRLVEIEPDGKYRLKGDGNGWKEREWITDVNVIGVVVGFYKKERLYKYHVDSSNYYRLMALMARVSRLHHKATSTMRRLENRGHKVIVLVLVYKTIYFITMFVLSFIINHLLTNSC